MNSQNLTPAQEAIVNEIESNLCDGEYEISVVYVGQSEEPVSIWVSVNSEDYCEDEDDEYEGDALYFDFDVRDSVVSCLSGVTVSHDFIIMSVDKYSREELLAAALNQ